MTVYARIDGPLGGMSVVGEEAADGSVAPASLSLPGQKGAVAVREGWRHAPEAFARVAEWLGDYFAGRAGVFGLPLASEGVGTPFQRRVWRVLDDIPYGVTTTYGEVAARVGVSGAGVRAVGTAVGRNPLLVVRPCHRVIGADGSLRGYAAGSERKELLLGLEGALVR
ncbi:methylated-DNA--[protein]-cysteine S-methyltransferase [Streptomyces roseolilacinus]|uniref:methylated-DNA--[protein]-cysteine S-methyltransferase n=1 Tax=Streptomyces roseolilacinus TaxID=66904 RepID=UPI003809692A